jgi:DNA phosphorothioation-dependent restriction protein DptG
VDTTDDAQTLPKNAPSKVYKRVKDVDLSKIGQKMQMILEREINLILDESRLGKLSDLSHRKFLNYLKFLPEIKKQEDEFLSDLPEEELEKLLNEKGKNHG